MMTYLDKAILEFLADQERKKYRMIWDYPEYRVNSPAVIALPSVWHFYERHKNGTFVDFGCGTGRALKFVVNTNRFRCLGVDTATNCLDPDVVGRVPLLVSDLALIPWAGFGPITSALPKSDFINAGMCVDVLEHLAPAVLDDALTAIANWAGDLCYFRIANFEETHGPAAGGAQLHQIFQDADWWSEKLEAHFNCVRRLVLDIDAAPERYSFICGSSPGMVVASVTD